MTIVAIFICLSINFLKVQCEYTAAVVEYFPVQERNLQPEERYRRNINGYIKILDELSQTTNLDIIVYPEATLTTGGVLTNHSDLASHAIEIDVNSTSLCDGPVTTFLTPLACAAVNYRTYIALNLYERTPCIDTKEKCPTDGWSLYNTNIVINRRGVIIAKYRKYNLFGEIYMTHPKTPDISIFRTDFNETFAMFICFDILFRQPSLDLVTQYGVKSILFSSMWFSELPFLTALQTQQQFAYATNVTFLASGANNRRRGSGGSGIYQGVKGPLIFTIVGTDESMGLIAKIPGAPEGSKDTNAIDQKAKKMDDFRLKSDRLEPYSSRSLIPGKNHTNATLCSQDNQAKICCHFHIDLKWDKNHMTDTKNHYHYHMVAFSGRRSFAGVSVGGLEVCAVVACLNDSLSSCGKRFPHYDNVSWPATFTKIVIRADFDVDPNKFQFPNSLLSNIEPIHSDAYEWTSTVSNRRILRKYKLTKPQNRLMTFGIYGRDFNRDSFTRSPFMFL